MAGSGTGVFSPIAAAWHESGHVLAESVALALTFVVAIIPWLVLGVPSLWLLIEGFRRLRGKATAYKKPNPTERSEQ
jgi:hypothetical protein